MMNVCRLKETCDWACLFIVWNPAVMRGCVNNIETRPRRIHRASAWGSLYGKRMGNGIAHCTCAYGWFSLWFPCGFPGHLWLSMLIKGEHTLTYSSHLRAERDCLATLSISPNLFVMLYNGKTK